MKRSRPYSIWCVSRTYKARDYAAVIARCCRYTAAFGFKRMSCATCHNSDLTALAAVRYSPPPIREGAAIGSELRHLYLRPSDTLIAAMQHRNSRRVCIGLRCWSAADRWPMAVDRLGVCRCACTAPPSLPPELMAPATLDLEAINLSGLADHSVSAEVIQPGDVLDVTMVTDYAKLTTTTTPVRVADDGTHHCPAGGQSERGRTGSGAGRTGGQRRERCPRRVPQSLHHGDHEAVPHPQGHGRGGRQQAGTARACRADRLR